MSNTDKSKILKELTDSLTEAGKKSLLSITSETRTLEEQNKLMDDSKNDTYANITKTWEKYNENIVKHNLLDNIDGKIKKWDFMQYQSFTKAMEGVDVELLLTNKHMKGVKKMKVNTDDIEKDSSFDFKDMELPPVQVVHVDYDCTMDIGHGSDTGIHIVRNPVDALVDSIKARKEYKKKLLGDLDVHMKLPEYMVPGYTYKSKAEMYEETDHSLRISAMLADEMEVYEKLIEGPKLSCTYSENIHTTPKINQYKKAPIHAMDNESLSRLLSSFDLMMLSRTTDFTGAGDGLNYKFKNYINLSPKDRIHDIRDWTLIRLALIPVSVEDVYKIVYTNFMYGLVTTGFIDQYSDKIFEEISRKCNIHAIKNTWFIFNLINSLKQMIDAKVHVVEMDSFTVDNSDRLNEILELTTSKNPYYGSKVMREGVCGAYGASSVNSMFDYEGDSIVLRKARGGKSVGLHNVIHASLRSKSIDKLRLKKATKVESNEMKRRSIIEKMNKGRKYR